MARFVFRRSPLAGARAWGRRLAVVPFLLAAGAIASACGSGGPGVASVGSTSTTTTLAAASPGPQAAGASADLVDFSNCMRHHGLPKFPLPVKTTNGYSLQITPASQIKKNSPVFQSAQAACNHFLPAGGAAKPITPQDQADYLKATQCMHSHGFPQLPDPTIKGTSVQFNVPSSINQNSAQFKRAVQTCEKLIPAGLPYSGSD